MAELIEKIFPIECKGRDAFGNEVLAEPVKVNVRISNKGTESMISLDVECIYNTGGHGQRCKASHPKFDNIVREKGIRCPYVCDIPYALEEKRA